MLIKFKVFDSPFDPAYQVQKDIITNFIKRTNANVRINTNNTANINKLTPNNL